MSTAASEGSVPREPSGQVRLGRPRALSREAVLDAALRIGDAHGLQALTVRRLAETLEVTGMTVYTYFKNKNELEQAVADALLQRVAPPPPSSSEPVAALSQFFTDLHGLCLEHPSLVGIFSAEPVVGPAAYERIDAVLELLRSSGATRESAVRAYRTITAYTLGSILLSEARDHAAPSASPQSRSPAGGSYSTLDDLRPLLDRMPTVEEFRNALEAVIRSCTPESARGSDPD
jgi:AcrR family transcriptional regulator